MPATTPHLLFTFGINHSITRGYLKKRLNPLDTTFTIEQLYKLKKFTLQFFFVAYHTYMDWFYKNLEVIWIITFILFTTRVFQVFSKETDVSSFDIWILIFFLVISALAGQKVSGNKNETKESYISTAEEFGMAAYDVNPEIIEKTFSNFEIESEFLRSSEGVRFRHYTYTCDKFTFSKIKKLLMNIELALATAPISLNYNSDQNEMTIMIPNEPWDTVNWRELRTLSKGLRIAFAKTEIGETFFLDLKETPHILIVGTTGSGKSMIADNVINTLFIKNKPEEVNFVFIDPKRVMLMQYADIPHTLQPIATDEDGYKKQLHFISEEVGKRKKLPKDELEKVPSVVVVVDEISDLMHSNLSAEFEGTLKQLIDSVEDLKIYTLLETSRPSKEVLSKTLQSLYGTRIVGSVASVEDSETVLGSPIAKRLLGSGNCYFRKNFDIEPKLIQSAYISDEEIHENIKMARKI